MDALRQDLLPCWTNRQEIRTIEQFQSKAMDIYSPHSTNAGAGEAQTKADK